MTFETLLNTISKKNALSALNNITKVSPISLPGIQMNCLVWLASVQVKLQILMTYHLKQLKPTGMLGNKNGWYTCAEVLFT